MVNEQLVMIDLENGNLSDSNPIIEAHTADRSDLPIKSEHCAASLSLADAHLVTKNRIASSETNSDRLGQKNDVSAVPRALARRSSLCWGVCLLTTSIAILLSILGTIAREDAATQIAHPELNDVIEYLLAHNISSHKDLTSEKSSRHLAARWLVETDPAELPLPVHYDFLYVTRYVMALNYFALNGDDWTVKVNFMTGKHVCHWNDAKHAYGSKGVETGGLLCDEKGMPEVLDLAYNGLSGSIPTENGLLTTLKVFDMEVNGYIQGIIPAELCNLVNLESLTLRGDDLGGRFAKLVYFNIESNNFSGPLPENVCDMTSMQYFVAQRNLFSGSLPSCMGKWTNLKVLAVSDNSFHGRLPTELIALQRLQELTIDDNQFNGDPLPIISTLTDLKILYASDNNFSGVLDTHVFKDLQELEIFDISHNSFTSTELPSRLLQMPKLEVLDLSMNSLKGPLPEDIEENSALWFFSANKNFFDGGIPSALTKLTSLRHLDLSENMFHGVLKSELFQMTSLVNLFLSENPFLHQGKIPETISGMTQLKELSMKNTNRNGTLPELLDFANLNLLDFDNNGFTGTIPENYANLRNLVYVMLNRNPIHGLVPDFGNAGLLHTLLLDGTGVWGNISSICKLPAFVGDPDSSARPIAVAECGGENSRISCACCHCCDAEATPRSGSCSDPIVASLDWTWEYGFQRDARNFGINRSALQDPIV